MSAKKKIASCKSCLRFRPANKSHGWTCDAILSPDDKGPEFVGDWIDRVTGSVRGVHPDGGDPIPNDTSSCPCFHRKVIG